MKFSQASWLLPNLDSNFFSIGYYVLLKNHNEPILWEEPDDTDFKALKESLMNLPTSLGIPIIRVLFSLLFMKRKEMPLGYFQPQGPPSTQRIL